TAAVPSWFPTMDTLGNLAVGALAIDPAHPDTLYAGNGDFVDTAGNTMLRSDDGGGTWSAPVALAGQYASGIKANVTAIRSIAVGSDAVFAATDAGLFVSHD